MPVVLNSLHAANFLRLGLFLVVWIVLFESAHLLILLLRTGPLVGWAIGPLGLTVMLMQEPSPLSIWLNVLFPALVSGLTVYIGLFTSLTPLRLPHTLLVEIITVASGLVLTSTFDVFHALRDLRYPMWGEARILRSIQSLHASWSAIHFTSFGLTYLRDHFDSNPSELLQLI